jgi:hypothetical protein
VYACWYGDFEIVVFAGGAHPAATYQGAAPRDMLTGIQRGTFADTDGCMARLS